MDNAARISARGRLHGVPGVGDGSVLAVELSDGNVSLAAGYGDGLGEIRPGVGELALLLHSARASELLRST